MIGPDRAPSNAPANRRGFESQGRANPLVVFGAQGWLGIGYPEAHIAGARLGYGCPMASEGEPARDSNRATGLGCLLLVGFMLVSALGAAYLVAPASAAAVTGSGGAPAPSESPSSTLSSAGDAPRTFNGPGSETPSWVNLSLSVGLPMDVVNPLLAYDPARDAIVLAGGSICLRNALGPTGCPQAFLSNSTWEYRGGHWTNISMDVGPCPKAVGNGYYQGFMVWDPVDSYLVLWDDFGATNKHGYFYYPQTWVLGSGVWTNITYQSASQPGKSGWAVYDPVDSYLLYIDSIGDTWNFTHGIWTWLGPWEALNHDNSTAGPPFQQVSELAWDSADQRALLYGEGAKLNQTWTFVGGEWTNTNTTGSLPPGNASIPLFYDDALHGVVYYGGPEQTSTAPAPSYTWVYSNGTWANITSAVGLAPPRPYYWGGAGAPDPQDGYYLVFAPVLPLVWPYPYLWAFADRPVAVLTASPYTVEANSSVAFDGQIFGGVGPFSFAYTDLPAGCAPPPTVVFSCRPTGVGTYEVGLNVTDSDGESGNTTAPLHVLSSLSLSVETGPAVLDVGQPWNLSANVSGGLPSVLVRLYRPARRMRERHVDRLVPTECGRHVLGRSPGHRFSRALHFLEQHGHGRTGPGRGGDARRRDHGSRRDRTDRLERLRRRGPVQRHRHRSTGRMPRVDRVSDLLPHDHRRRFHPHRPRERFPRGDRRGERHHHRRSASRDPPLLCLPVDRFGRVEPPAGHQRDGRHRDPDLPLHGPPDRLLLGEHVGPRLYPERLRHLVGLRSRA